MALLKRIFLFHNNDSPAARKDRILFFLINPDSSRTSRTTRDIAPLVGLTWFTCNYYCHQLRDNGLIETIGVTATENGVAHELLIKWPTEKAKMFMLDGGHRAIARKNDLKRFAGHLLICITTINAFVATYVAYLTYTVSDDTKTLNRQLVERDRRIDSLIKKVSEIIIAKPQSATGLNTIVPQVKDTLKQLPKKVNKT